MNEMQRHYEILSLLKQTHFINVSSIIKKFNISPATARRDITKLDEQGKLKKIRNGAERIEDNKSIWSPLNIISTDYYSEKSLIAMQAAKLCSAGDSVVISCGSTAFLLGRQLCGQNIQIVTNYYPLTNYLIEMEHDNIILLGGQYNKDQKFFLNASLNSPTGYAGNWMFTSGKGLTEMGLYKTEMLTVLAEQQILEQIDKLVVLVDSSKIGSRTGLLFCPATKIDILITGKNADRDVINGLKKQGVKVILV